MLPGGRSVIGPGDPVAHSREHPLIARLRAERPQRRQAERSSLAPQTPLARRPCLRGWRHDAVRYGVAASVTFEVR